MIYVQEMTHYDNNNEFFAQLPPLSPINSSRITLSLADNSLQLQKQFFKPAGI